MKKIIVFFAAACLLTFGNVYASDWYAPNDQTAIFTLGVVCEPALTGGASENIGTYFTGNINLSLTTPTTLSWFLTGPSSSVASYAVRSPSYNGGVSDLPGGTIDVTASTGVIITATGGEGGNSILHGDWVLPSLGAGSLVHCATGNQDCMIQFVPTSIDTYGTGVQTFNISLSVTVNV